MKFSFFLLNRYRRTLRTIYRLYRRKAKKMSLSAQDEMKMRLTQLQEAIQEKDVEKSRLAAENLTLSAKRLMPKTWVDSLRELVTSLLFALIVAIVIRQMWFELYTIPSGSMRPTLKESDLLLVSKTDFGINTLGRTSHLYFDPNLVGRGEIVVFSVENMDVPDPDTMYFYILPGKKQYVKRLIGKPGDTLYFYGGLIYGIDREGHEIETFQSEPWALSIEHIPFIRFDGKAKTSSFPQEHIFSPVVFYQMNEPIAKLSAIDSLHSSAEMLLPIRNYFDVWGFKNYAMARLLTASQLPKGLELPSAQLYLELTHHPSLEPSPITVDEYQRLRPTLSTQRSYIPLSSEKIQKILQHMTTCRFIVKNGLATRYGSSFDSPTHPHFPQMASGTYEIQNGEAYRVWGGVVYKLSNDHTLLSSSPENVQKLFNTGIEMDMIFNGNRSTMMPSRYAYFRSGSLYLMNTPIFDATDPELIAFVEKEKKSSLTPFVDAGAPRLANGTLDRNFIRQYGLTVPDKMYLVLGDNHAMSADSRYFGFVPQDNLRGGASFILWPVGARWGRLPQSAIDYLTWPNLAVWGVFILITISTMIYVRRKKIKLF